MSIQTINPATEALIETYECLYEPAISEKIKESQSAFLSWSALDFEQRAVFMRQMAKILLEQKKELAKLIAQEMGKPIKAGQAEIEKCAWVCEHYASEASNYLAPRFIETQMSESKVCYRPLGLVFAIMPWNFPFWQVFRFVAPGLMAGNGVLLKHAAITTGCGERIPMLFEEAGFPKNLVQHLILDNEGASQVIANPHVKAVTLTGSEQAGRSVASQAGAHLKKSVLELGGNDPFIILEDADLNLAADCIVASRLNNSGQVCIAAKRIIVQNQIEEELTQKIIERLASFKMGDPLNPNTSLGPLARKDLRETLHQQVEKSLKLGANLWLGGIIPQNLGFYYPPTLLTGVKPGMPAFDEELFGPVIAIITAQNEEDAIQLANQSSYGLGAAIFTQDVKKGEYLATQKIEAGVCFVNALVASDPRLPFGGIKHSGYGRELSQEGILEFVNIKTIAIK